MKQRGKRKTNKDEKRGWHPNMQPSVISSWLNSQTHKVEVLGTLHPQTLCFDLDENKKQVKDKGKRQSGWFGCEKEGNGKQQTKLGFKSIRRVINKTTNHHLSSHDAKAEHVHSTSVVLGASGHLWCHEKRCAHTTCHGHACLH